jgi:hypothetical protein
MHQALALYELLYMIFRHCTDDRMTLARLCRTCRHFNRLAASILWESLPSLDHLAVFYPSELVRQSIKLRDYKVWIAYFTSPPFLLTHTV